MIIIHKDILRGKRRQRMQVKGITDECFSDYKVPSMFIAFPSCTFKCDRENGCNLCQNSFLAQEPNITISKEELIERFLANPITEAIVCGGLEPFDSILDLSSFIECLRTKYESNAPVIIYTGYTEQEIFEGKFGPSPIALRSIIRRITTIGNVIIKYGRFRPNQEKHYDDVLGVVLASPNQYAKQYN